uniref:Uncharacterized protein n=1 Tax=Oryza brachyantha TaxID=4533 RepID=J3LKB2_ORYBR
MINFIQHERVAPQYINFDPIRQFHTASSEDIARSITMIRIRRQQVLPLALVFLLIFSATINISNASRLLGARAQPRQGSSVFLTSAHPGASGCTNDPNNPGGRCQTP